MENKKKITSILWGLGYFFVTMCILVSACILFHNNYFSLIYVEGTSMTPTLNKNGLTEFGIVDGHKTKIDHIKRFDIVTTYYPIKYHSSSGYISDYSYIDENGKEQYTSYFDTEHEVKITKNADFKIKRIIALPGESFKVVDEGVLVKNNDEEPTLYEFTFTHSAGNKTDEDYRTLADDEYWVLGDNWGGSIDSKAIDCPIKRGNIQGVLIAIEGTCKVKTSNGKVQITNKKYYSAFRYF